MKSKEEFKIFVKSHPELISYVRSNDMTWQKFYELYSLYDEDDNAWSQYLKNNKETIIENKEKDLTLKNMPGFNEIFNMIKNIKPEVIQQNITSIQKFLGFVSDFVGDNSNKTDSTKSRSIYTPRPTHKMFDD